MPLIRNYHSKSGGFLMKPNPNLPMFQHQPEEPLPVPALSETLTKFKQSLIPILTQSGKSQNELDALVKEFEQSPLSQELQKRLLARQQEQSSKFGKNWFIDWWNDLAYMGYRDSVVINVSYFFHFQDDVRRMESCHRAASLIHLAMQFRQQVVSQSLTPDMAGRSPNEFGLCMKQYLYMFNSCRIPHQPSDTTATFDPEVNSHVTVVRKGRFYTVPCLDKSGNILSVADLTVQLKKVKQHADQLGWDAYPLGALTSDNRDKWYHARESLIAYTPANQEALERIESSAFLLALDDGKPVTREETGRALWHGDGRNRFYDKSIQFIVFENGKAGLLGEHSMMDATPLFRMSDTMLETTAQGKLKDGVTSPADTLPNPEPVEFQYPPHYETNIVTALQRLRRDIQANDHKVLAYEGYGKELIKSFRMSPDAYVQLSIQLAYYKLFGKCRPTYESSQTKKYAWGRTEVTRSLSVESLAFCKAMVDPAVSQEERIALGVKAVRAHSAYMSDAVDGKGCDRHLLGLRLVMKPGEKVALFEDPVFKDSSYWYVSTSQITSEYFDGWGWGQVVPDGYGIAYMIKENSVHYNIAALKGGPGYDHGPGSWDGKGKGIAEPCAKLAHYLQESLHEMRSVFTSAQKAKAKL